MKKIVLILICFLIVLSGIGIASAETLTGIIGGSNYTTTTITQASATSSTPYPIPGLYVKLFENTGNLKSIVLWSKSAGTAFSTDAGAPSGSSIPVTIRISNQTLNTTTHKHVLTTGRIVGTGTFGYQKVFTTATPPVEVPASGYLWLALDSWDLGTETGSQFLYMEYDPASIYNVSYGFFGGSSVGIPNGFGTFEVVNVAVASDGAGNTQLNLKDNSVSASYTVTKPAGVGIMGSISKSVGGQNYTSQALVYDAAGTIISSESTLTQYTFNFSVISEQVILGIKDGAGNKYNTSLLFTPGGVTPTPTVTPTPVPTIVPGYVRSTLHVWDRAGNHVNGANIAIKDNEAGVWSNSTSDADGIHYIDTLPYHTLDAYAEFTIFANELLPGEVIGHDVGYYGGSFFITLYPYESGATPGNVSFYVEVKDAQTKNYLTYAIVDLTVSSTGRTYSQNTANAGSAIFLVPNNTVVYATARKDGYVPQTQFANSGVDTTEVITIELSRAVVTPTPTGVIPTGGVTPAITVDPVGTPDDKGNYPSGYSNVKGQQMLDYLAANGMQLVQLCFLVTILALLGIKLGK